MTYKELGDLIALVARSCDEKDWPTLREGIDALAQDRDRWRTRCLATEHRCKELEARLNVARLQAALLDVPSGYRAFTVIEGGKNDD